MDFRKAICIRLESIKQHVVVYHDTMPLRINYLNACCKYRFMDSSGYVCLFNRKKKKSFSRMEKTMTNCSEIYLQLSLSKNKKKVEREFFFEKLLFLHFSFSSLYPHVHTSGCYKMMCTQKHTRMMLQKIFCSKSEIETFVISYFTLTC